MAEGLPEIYRKSAEVQVSYNSEDLISGTGYIAIYGGRSTAAYLLSNITYYSDGLNEATVTNTPYTSNAGTDVGYTKRTDIDFDVLVNKPLTLKGKAIINVPYGVGCQGASTGYHKLRALIRKWNGTTETTIATTDYSVAISGGGACGTSGVAALSIDVSATSFAIGEYIRLTIEGYGYTTNGADAYTLYTAHDPVARTLTIGASTFTSSKSLFQMPVRIDI